MTRRHAFTIVEVTIALAVGVLLLAVAFSMVHFMGKSEESTDRDSVRAMASARMMQILLFDLRSACAPVVKVSETEYAVDRTVVDGSGAAATRKITWKVAGDKVLRVAPPEPQQEFNFKDLMLPADGPTFKLRVEQIPDGTF